MLAASRPEVARPVEPHHTAEQWVARRAKVARRRDAIRLALLGHTAAESAERVLVTERPVRVCVARYNDRTEALTDRTGRGRKGPLAGDEAERLKARLRAGPTAGCASCAGRTCGASSGPSSG